MDTFSPRLQPEVFLRPCLVLAAFFCGALAASGAAPVCTINGATTYQTIDGFGAGAVFLYADKGQVPLHQEWVDSVFGRNPGELGLSIIRLRIDPDRDWASAVADAQKAHALGVQILATPWTPPGAWKLNTNAGFADGSVGGTLDPAHYGDFADYLNEFAAHMAASDAPLTVISLQNEPDFIPPDYEGCGWTAANFLDFCRSYASRITVPVMIGESFSSNLSLTDSALSDATAAANFDYIGEHLYGGGPNPYSSAATKGKHVWMTEYLVNSQTMASALSTAVQVNDTLTRCGWNAYIWWKVIGDANGLLNNAGEIQRRGYVFGQFSRFVRPGDVRIGIGGSADSALSISAFRDPDSERFTIVVVNSSAYDVKQFFQLSGLPDVESLKPWLTSETDSMDMQPNVDLIDNSFRYSIPAETVVTFVGNPEASDYDPLRWFAPYDTDENGRINSEWFGSFWDVGEQYLYHCDLRWIYTLKQGDFFYLYAYNGLGWMVTTANAYPYVYLYDVPTADGQGRESGWAYVAETGDGTTWLYFFEGTRTTGGTDPAYPGWWRF
jgi:O-glycosyl hydrolase